MASVRVGEAEVAYSLTGSGTPVLLLHGAGASKDINWGFLTERLAGRFTVLAPDLPGSGETTDQDAPLQYAALVAQALAVAAVGGQRFHVVGYSLGAHLAAAVAAAAAQSVLSLTAIAGWVRPGRRRSTTWE